MCDDPVVQSSCLTEASPAPVLERQLSIIDDLPNPLPDVTEQQLREDALGLDKRFIQATGAQSLPLDAHTRCEAAVLLGQPGAHKHAAWFERIEHLVHTALNRLRRELPGCSISLSAPPEAVKALTQQGFVVDPGGIRAMGLALR